MSTFTIIFRTITIIALTIALGYFCTACSARVVTSAPCDSDPCTAYTACVAEQTATANCADGVCICTPHHEGENRIESCELPHAPLSCNTASAEAGGIGCSGNAIVVTCDGSIHQRADISDYIGATDVCTPGKSGAVACCYARGEMPVGLVSL